MRDTTYYCDFYADLFITHGGLFSKKVVAQLLKCGSLSPKQQLIWKQIKQYVLAAIHTSDEVSERQPVLAKMFTALGMGRAKPIVRTVGDIVLRDFVVEVKQPNFLSNSNAESSSERLNDQQLIEAMSARRKSWGILTNAAEWQFFHAFEEGNSLGFPFISFSLLDMILHEEAAQSHIALFVNLLTKREVRHFLIRETEEVRRRATTAFGEELKRIIGHANELGLSEDKIDTLVKLLFRLTFLFYCEDIGALPRHELKYRKFDIRRHLSESKPFPVSVVRGALKAFAAQAWSAKKVSDCGNTEFWDYELDSFLSSFGNLPQQARFQALWFTQDFEELDMSEISSSDLCDVYQHVIHKTEDNLGSFYTRPELSRFVNYNLLSQKMPELQPGDIILDPSCGSGHLLKRTLFIADRLLKQDPKQTRASLVRNFCTNHLAGIDKSETAIFIAKMNLWLSCVAKAESLPKMKRFVVGDTLKRFVEAHRDDGELASSKFIGELGSRIAAIVSNPPWKMAEGEGHGLEWLRTDPFWKARKEQINTQKINIALYFAYVNFQVLSQNGIAVMILPSTFFVGTESVVRDTLGNHIVGYAPFQTNSLFVGVDKSQSYGIIAFSKKANSQPLKVYLDLEQTKHTSFELNDDIRMLPENRSGKEFGFSTRTLLPLFTSEQDHREFEEMILRTRWGAYWVKGSQRGTIRTREQLAEVPVSARPGEYYFVAPEGGGNSRNPLRPRCVNRLTYSQCNKDFHRIRVKAGKGAAIAFEKYLNSEALNSVLRSIKGVRNLPAAILNLIGIPKTMRGIEPLEPVSLGSERKVA